MLLEALESEVDGQWKLSSSLVVQDSREDNILEGPHTKKRWLIVLFNSISPNILVNFHGQEQFSS